MSAATGRFRMRHHWSGEAGGRPFAPYRYNKHDVDTDVRVRYDWLNKLLQEAGIEDGEVFEIIVRKTGDVDTTGHWELTEPHVYSRVLGPSPERATSKGGTPR